MNNKYAAETQGEGRRGHTLLVSGLVPCDCVFTVLPMAGFYCQESQKCFVYFLKNRVKIEIR